MIKFISEFMVNILLNNGLENKTKNELEIYQYGFEITLSSILNVIIVLIIGMIFNSILSSIIFISCFYLIRRQTGGYHADSYFKCNIVFGATFTFVILISHIAVYNDMCIYALIVCVLLGLISIHKYTPVPNKHKPLTTEQKTINHRNANIRYILTFLIGCVVYHFNKLYGAVIFSTLISIVVLVLYSVVREKEVDSHES